jgi:uncharacterized protein (DUF1810 family)
MAVRFAISSVEEARAYLEHPVLGARLRECTEIVLRICGRAGAGTTVGEIFGYPDDLKFHSCVTLFALAAEQSAEAAEGSEDTVFREALTTCFGGEVDRGTLERI